MAQNDVVKSCNDLILHYNDGLISCNNVLSLCDDMIQQLNDVLCSWDDVLPPHKDVKKLGNDVLRSYNDVLSPYNDLHLPQNDVSSGGKGRDPRLKQLPNDILFLLINLLQNREGTPQEFLLHQILLNIEFSPVECQEESNHHGNESKHEQIAVVGGSRW